MNRNHQNFNHSARLFSPAFPSPLSATGGDSTATSFGGFKSIIPKSHNPPGNVFSNPTNRSFKPQFGHYRASNRMGAATHAGESTSNLVPTTGMACHDNNLYDLDINMEYEEPYSTGLHNGTHFVHVGNQHAAFNDQAGFHHSGVAPLYDPLGNGISHYDQPCLPLDENPSQDDFLQLEIDESHFESYPTTGYSTGRPLIAQQPSRPHNSFKNAGVAGYQEIPRQNDFFASQRAMQPQSTGYHQMPQDNRQYPPNQAWNGRPNVPHAHAQPPMIQQSRPSYQTTQQQNAVSRKPFVPVHASQQRGIAPVRPTIRQNNSQPMQQFQQSSTGRSPLHSQVSTRQSPMQQRFQSSTHHPSPLQQTVQRQFPAPTSRHPVNPNVILNLIPVSSLPDRFKRFFSFPYFNRMQSESFETTFHSDGNLVVSSPTGSGKTVLMELCILRLLTKPNSENAKIIYIAPTKALVSERARDWKTKFASLGLSVGELTGDSEYQEMDSLKRANIIVTTPEKWDSTTRRWSDHRALLSLVRLLLVDEVHILHESKRGACLEAVITRMKTILSSQEGIRIIAISATCPNIVDLAKWIGPGNASGAIGAKYFAFGEEYRPVPLQLVVQGFPGQKENVFLFDKSLDYKVMDIINQYSHDRPTLIFNATRKSTVALAELLAKESQASGRSFVDSNNYARANEASTRFNDRKMGELVRSGICYHHAGLDHKDRLLCEQLFLQGVIKVICTTSTLSVGVNLPAHLVIIKGTMGYTGDGYTEYSDFDLLQMIGRAGRPQFDDTGVAVIMTHSTTTHKFENLACGKEVIESSLHENLIEHLNAEVVLGTITSIESGIKWLKSSFLYVRINKNPSHYSKIVDQNGHAVARVGSVESELQQLCIKGLQKLTEHELVQMAQSQAGNSSAKLSPLPLALSMAKYYVKYETVVKLTQIKRNASLQEILSLLCSAEEYKEIRFQHGEKTALNAVNKQLRFPIKGNKVKLTEDKVNVILQCALGYVELNTGSALKLQQDMKMIMKHAIRILKLFEDYFVLKRDVASLKSTIHLMQCLNARTWENTDSIFRQIPDVGQAISKAIWKSGCHSMLRLDEMHSREVEFAANRNPPFGGKIKDALAGFPQFFLHAKQVSVLGRNVDFEVVVGLKNEATCKTRDKGAICYATLIVCMKPRPEPTTTVNPFKGRRKAKEKDDKTSTSSQNASEPIFIECRRYPLFKLKTPQTLSVRAPLTNFNDKVEFSVSCEEFVGFDVQHEIKPTINPMDFISFQGRYQEAPIPISSHDASPRPLGTVAIPTRGVMETAIPTAYSSRPIYASEKSASCSEFLKANALVTADSTDPFEPVLTSHFHSTTNQGNTNSVIKSRDGAETDPFAMFDDLDFAFQPIFDEMPSENDGVIKSNPSSHAKADVQATSTARPVNVPSSTNNGFMTSLAPDAPTSVSLSSIEPPSKPTVRKRSVPKPTEKKRKIHNVTRFLDLEAREEGHVLDEEMEDDSCEGFVVPDGLHETPIDDFDDTLNEIDEVIAAMDKPGVRQDSRHKVQSPKVASNSALPPITDEVKSLIESYLSSDDDDFDIKKPPRKKVIIRGIDLSDSESEVDNPNPVQGRVNPGNTSNVRGETSKKAFVLKPSKLPPKSKICAPASSNSTDNRSRNNSSKALKPTSNLSKTPGFSFNSLLDSSSSDSDCGFMRLPRKSDLPPLPNRKDDGRKHTIDLTEDKEGNRGLGNGETKPTGRTAVSTQVSSQMRSWLHNLRAANDNASVKGDIQPATCVASTATSSTVPAKRSLSNRQANLPSSKADATSGKESRIAKHVLSQFWSLRG